MNINSQFPLLSEEAIEACYNFINERVMLPVSRVAYKINDEMILELLKQYIEKPDKHSYLEGACNYASIDVIDFMTKRSWHLPYGFEMHVRYYRYLGACCVKTIEALDNALTYKEWVRIHQYLPKDFKWDIKNINCIFYEQLKVTPEDYENMKEFVTFREKFTKMLVEGSDVIG